MPDEKGGATIVLSRKREGYRDFLRSYVVLVDSEEVAKIKRGQTVELPITAGSHEVFLKIDWCRSPALHIQASPGEVVKLFCEPGVKPGTSVQEAMANNDTYISLTRL
jgi:hypothetical protein